MKQGLFLGLLVGLVTLAPKLVVADYQLNVTTGRASTDVPMGNVIVRLTTEVGNRLNTSGGIGGFGLSVPANSSVEVLVQPKAMNLTTTRGSTTFGSDLTFNSTFSPQTVISSYERKVTGGAIVTANPSESFAATSNFQINVGFGLATQSSAKEYQFYFGTNAPLIPPPTDPQDLLGKGNYFSTNPQNSMVIPWSVISFLGSGNNLYGTIRVIDFAHRVNDFSFEFDVTPMGGGAAIPEPSTWWAVGLVASCYGGRVAWRKWRKRRPIEVL